VTLTGMGLLWMALPSESPPPHTPFRSFNRLSTFALQGTGPPWPPLFLVWCWLFAARALGPATRSMADQPRLSGERTLRAPSGLPSQRINSGPPSSEAQAAGGRTRIFATTGSTDASRRGDSRRRPHRALRRFAQEGRTWRAFAAC